MKLLVLSVTARQICRDGVKREESCKKNAVNGANGGRPQKAKKPTGFSENPTKPKKADKDKEEDTDKETEKDKDTVTDTEEEKETDTVTEKDKVTEKMLTQKESDEFVSLSSLSSV
ncbi:MAG: hypothetical protein ACI4RN_00375 [Oscillospiraceae bacterium]